MSLDAENLLCPVPVSTRDNTTRGLAVFQVSPQLPGRRKSGGCIYGALSMVKAKCWIFWSSHAATRRQR